MLISQCLAVVALCWVSLVRSQSGSELQSVTQRSPGVTVSVSSVRNQTGHWISQVCIRHKDERKHSAPWSVEVEPSTVSCGGGSKPTLDVKLTFTAPPPTARAAPGYELSPGLGYYKFHSDVATWPRAREVCEAEGGHLVVINSEEESKAMVKLFGKFPNIVGASEKDFAFVGLRESESTNGLYFNVFGELAGKAGGFWRWHLNEPNNISLGDFILIHRSSGGFADVPAALNYKMPFICKQIDID